MDNRSIAAAQTVPLGGDVDANVEQHLRLASVAGQGGVQVLVFPELSLTGYELDRAAELAFVNDDLRLEPLASSACSNDMTLIVGAPVQIASELYIGAFILLPDGSIDLYTKRHLGAFPASANPRGAVPPREDMIFQPGDRNPLVQLDAGPAAIAVCADVGRPAHAEVAASRGARTYLASMFLIPSDYEQEAARLESYAKAHSMAVVLANYGGASGGLPSAGQSAIWSDRGKLLARMDPAGAGIVIGSDDPEGWTAQVVPVELP